MSRDDRRRIRQAAIEALAVTHGADETDIEGMILEAGGDASVALDSKTAEFVIASVEVAFGLRLPTPADLGKRRYRTLDALVHALSAHVAAAS